MNDIQMRFLSLVMFALPFMVAQAQSTNAPVNEDYYHWIDRYEIKSGKVIPQVFSSVKPYKRDAIILAIDSLNESGQFSTEADRYNYTYLRNDSWEWSRSEENQSKKPFLKHIYKKKSDFLYADLPEFDIHVNPVLYTSIGYDNQEGEDLYINTRGLEIRGMVDRKVGFYSFLSENQARLPNYVRSGMASNPVIPHEGFWKTFKDNGVDFFHVRGYIDFSLSKHISHPGCPHSDQHLHKFRSGY